jgi:hypothetical protein
VTKSWPGKDTTGIFKNKGHIKREAQCQQKQNRGKDNDLLTLGEGWSRQFSLLTHNALSGLPEKGNESAPSVNPFRGDEHAAMRTSQRAGRRSSRPASQPNHPRQKWKPSSTVSLRGVT